MQPIHEALQNISEGEYDSPANCDNSNLSDVAVRVANFLPDSNHEVRCLDPDRIELIAWAMADMVDKVIREGSESPTHDQILAIASQIWTLATKNCPECLNKNCTFRERQENTSANSA